MQRRSQRQAARAQADHVQKDTSITARAEEVKEVIGNTTYELLDEWMKDNHYILTGYRTMSNSFRKSFASVFAIHNETVNIWTHLVPGVFLLFVTSVLLSSKVYPGTSSLYRQFHRRYPHATNRDFTVVAIFIASAIIMFSASWTYHTVSNHSHKVSMYWNKLDYVGIIFMIIGSFVPSIYYGHYCEPASISFYLSLVSGFGIVTFFFTILNRFRTPAWRPYRAGMFVLLGLSAIIPMAEALSTNGLARMSQEMSLWYCVAQGVLYTTGAVIYAMRIPEKHYPRTFDIVGSSHQIFHCCVVLAAIVHAVGVYKAFHHRHGTLHGLCGRRFGVSVSGGTINKSS